MATTSKVYDALIIGSGPAGLSAALGLARQLYTAVVFDSQQYRNYPADRMHNVITWDHRPPEEFRTSARNNISDRYKTIEFRQARVETIRRLNDGTFEAVDGQQNRTIGKKVVLATGVTDVLPLEIKGFSTLWGKSMFVNQFSPSLHPSTEDCQIPLPFLPRLRRSRRTIRGRSWFWGAH